MKVETVWKMLDIFPLELFARPLRSSSCTLVLPSLNNRHHFFTFPSFIAIMLMWISAGRTFFAFKNRITYRRSQAAGFSCSSLTSTANEEKITTQYYAIQVPIDIQKTADLYKKCARLAFQKRLLLLGLLLLLLLSLLHHNSWWYEDT